MNCIIIPSYNHHVCKAINFGSVNVYIGGYTYAVTTSNGANGIEIIDITDPSSPTSAASISGTDALKFGFGITSIHLDGESFILASSYKKHGVSIINITEPKSPDTVLNIFDGAEYPILKGPDGITTVEINDSHYALVASRSNSGVQIIRLDHPATTTPLPNLITSSNTNSSYAKTGDTITVQINANHDITSYDVAILDSTLDHTVVHSGRSLNASVDVPFNSALGNATFNITISNSISSLVVTENDLTSDNVFIGDTSLIANATISSNNANAFFAKPNDVISITLYTNVLIHNATLDILGTTVDMTVANKMAFTNVTVLSNAPNGPIMFDITVHDDAHNRFVITENNVISGSVTIDSSKPNLTNLTIYSNNTHNTSLATMPLVLIVYVAPRIVIFALARSSFVVIVMFRASPKVASEVLWVLLLYMVRFVKFGFDESIVTLPDMTLFSVITNLLWASSCTVMSNIIGPFGAFDKTVTFVKAILFATVISTVVPKISSVALCISTLV